MLRRIIKRLFPDPLPRGCDFASDLRRAYPGYVVKTVFDVGANTGQSAAQYVKVFPHALIHSFEPVRSTFKELQANTSSLPLVRCYPLALGAATGKVTMSVGPDSRFASITQDAGEAVDMTTVDTFCSERGISHIHFLKVDCEGADLDVLRGGKDMILDHRIDFIQVEAGMNNGNERHIPIEAFKSHLESRGYYLFGIYSQVLESQVVPGSLPILRRCNPVFVSGRVSF